jgi:hypothetical protein
MVKVYEMARFDAMTIRLNYCGQTILANFKGGVNAKVRARLTTSDRFVQDALEADPRYGTLYRMLRSYKDAPCYNVRNVEVDNKPKKITKVKDINGALRFFTEMGASVTGESDLKALMEKYNVEFPNLK